MVAGGEVATPVRRGGAVLAAPVGQAAASLAVTAAVRLAAFVDGAALCAPAAFVPVAFVPAACAPAAFEARPPAAFEARPPPAFLAGPTAGCFVPDAFLMGAPDAGFVPLGPGGDCLAVDLLARADVLAAVSLPVAAAFGLTGAARLGRPAELSSGPCTASLSHPGAKMCLST
jgi:hypothetical protein